MPSQTTSWITNHGPLSVLHVTSTNPRRGGAEDLAIFESDLCGILSVYEWRIRHSKIENQYGKTLLSIITGIRNLGSCQIEPNCDYTKDNFRYRPAPSDDRTHLLDKFRADNPDWKQIQWQTKHGCEFFPKMKYKNRAEWTTLTISLADGGSVDIKINKWLVNKIPMKMVYRPKRPHNQLYMLPNSAQMKRLKHDNDRRHGKALTAYLLETVENFDTGNYRLLDRFDYRINENNEFVSACKISNKWHDIDGGSVLEVNFPAEFCKKSWDTPQLNIYPKLESVQIPMGMARKCYFFMTDVVADTAKDYHWDADEYEAFSNNVNGKRVRLARMVCEIGGVQTIGISEPSRMSKYYEKAINGTDNKSLRRRAKFENTITTEQKTSNHMYVHGKFISHKRLHLEKFIDIPELNITALDMRLQSIRVGGQSEETQHHSTSR
jgi:hypothetical protein